MHSFTRLMSSCGYLSLKLFSNCLADSLTKNGSRLDSHSWIWQDDPFFLKQQKKEVHVLRTELFDVWKCFEASIKTLTETNINAVCVFLRVTRHMRLILFLLCTKCPVIIMAVSLRTDATEWRELRWNTFI